MTVHGDRYRIELGPYVLTPLFRTVRPVACRDGKALHDIKLYKVRRVPPERQYVPLYRKRDN